MNLIPPSNSAQPTPGTAVPLQVLSTETSGLQYYQQPAFLSTTSLAALFRCPRKFFYQAGCRLTESGPPRPPLKFGEAIHAAMPHLLVHNNFKAAMDTFLAIWRPALGQGMAEDEKRNVENVRMIFMAILDSFANGNGLYNLKRPPTDAITPSDIQSDYEIPFTLFIPGMHIPIVSRVDGWADHRDTSQTWGVEFKTSSEAGSRILRAFDLNMQIMTYTLALRQLFDPSIPGMMVTIIPVVKTKHSTLTKPLYIPEYQLDQFVRSVAFQGNLLRVFESIREFPVNGFAGCTPYSMFGQPGYMCPFDVLCQVKDWTALRSAFKISDYMPFVTSDPDLQQIINEIVNKTTDPHIGALSYKDVKVLPHIPEGVDGVEISHED